MRAVCVVRASYQVSRSGWRTSGETEYAIRNTQYATHESAMSESTDSIFGAAPPLPDWLAAEMPFRRRIFAGAGHAVHFVDDGDGPAVWLQHGNPTWCYLWRKVIRLLLDRRHARHRARPGGAGPQRQAAGPGGPHPGPSRRPGRGPGRRPGLERPHHRRPGLGRAHHGGAGRPAARPGPRRRLCQHLPGRAAPPAPADLVPPALPHAGRQ